MQLQGELADIENKLAAARRYFNNAISEYNASIQQFPAVLLAGAMGFQPRDFFDLGENRATAEIAPQVHSILDGLKVAHENGIIHRDLKPENILIDRYRRWRIADFGIANAMGEEWAGSSGTPAFAPPEQLLGEQQGVAADLFAVAAITYYVLAGVAPFAGVDGRAILAQQLAGKVDVSAFHPALAAWFKRGMNADPDQRFVDAAEMQREWARVSQDVLEEETHTPFGRRMTASLGKWLGR